MCESCGLTETPYVPYKWNPVILSPVEETNRHNGAFYTCEIEHESNSP